MRTLTRTLAVVVAATVALSAQALSSRRLERIDRYFQDEIDAQRMAGAGALVLQDGKPV